MTTVTPLHRSLWEHPTYRSLSPPRRKVAVAVICDGKPFGPTCKAEGLNVTRERANIDLACLLREFQGEAGTPVDPKRVGKGFVDLRQEVLYAYHSILERLEGAPHSGGLIPGPDCVYAAEIVANQPHSQADTGLDAQKVAQAVAELRAALAAFSSWDEARQARKAELASRALCDSCTGPMSEPRAIAGTKVLCSSCGETWRKTGKVA